MLNFFLSVQIFPRQFTKKHLHFLTSGTASGVFFSHISLLDMYIDMKVMIEGSKVAVRMISTLALQEWVGEVPKLVEFFTGKEMCLALLFTVALIADAYDRNIEPQLTNEKFLAELIRFSTVTVYHPVCIHPK